MSALYIYPTYFSYILIVHFSVIQFKSASLIGLPHLRMQSTDSERGPTPAHLLTADQEVGAPMRSDSADPQGERGLFRLADEVVLWSRATVNLLTVIYLLCPLSHMICGISRASCRVMPEYAISGYVLYLEGYGPY